MQPLEPDGLAAKSVSALQSPCEMKNPGCRRRVRQNRKEEPTVAFDLIAFDLVHDAPITQLDAKEQIMNIPICKAARLEEECSPCPTERD
jgi:hypothetical protein